MNFLKNASKTTERHNLAVCGSLCGEKQVFVNIYPFYWFDKKNCLNISKFSSGFASFKHGKKNKLSEYFSAISEIVTFMSKKKNFSMNFLKNA